MRVRPTSSFRLVAVLAALGLMPLVAPAAPAAALVDPGAAPVATPFQARIDFTTAAGTLAPGYARDFGAAYSTSAGRGWVREADPDAGLNLSLNGRVRACPALPVEASLVHMDYPATANQTGGTSGRGAYRLDVPSGTYRVLSAVGEPAPGNDLETHVLNVEGVPLVTAFPKTTGGACSLTPVGAPRTSTQVKTGEAVVEVTDGSLLVDSVGGTNTKILYLEVEQLTGALPLTVDFVDQYGPVVPDALRDFGQGYGESRGFGWVAPATSDPLSVVGNGRTRSTTTTLEASMVHAQYADIVGTNGVRTRADWEVAVVDGTYQVEVGVGDLTPGTDPTRHSVRAEGSPAQVLETVNAARTPVGPATATFTYPQVTVTDGRLTLGMVEGLNTKLTFVRLTRAADVTAPAAPTGVVATAGDGTVALDWADAAPADGVVDWVITRTADGQPDIQTASTSSSLTVNGLTNGTEYTFTVVARDAARNDSAPSAAVTATPAEPAPDDVAPPAPTGLTAAAGDGQVTLDWDDAAAADGVTGWTVTRTTAGQTDVTTPAATSGLLVSDLANGTAYTFTVTATGPGGLVSPASAAATATPQAAGPGPDVTPPAAPASLTATPGDASAALDWADADAADGVTRWEVTQTPGAVVSETTTSALEVTGLTNGTAYTFSVVALDAADNASTPSTASATPEAVDTTAPLPATGLAAVGGATGNVLTWVAATDPDRTGFRVFRTAPGDRTELTTSTISTPTYTDATAAEGVATSYEVVAVDAAGNASAPATATATRPTAFGAKVDFVDQTGLLADGYLRDFGQGFGPKTGSDQGGLTYGWVTPGTATPLPLIGNGRTRAATLATGVTDRRLLSLLHVQGDDLDGQGGRGLFGNIRAEGAWELAVPNGTYDVRIGVGDYNTDSNVNDTPAHSIRVEGVPALTRYVPTGVSGTSTRFAQATARVQVTDGRLTLDAVGGFNTKISYVDVAPRDGIAPATLTPDPAQVAVTAAVGGPSATGQLTLTESPAGARITPVAAAPWLQAVALRSGGALKVAYGASPVGLAPGTYTSQVVVTALGYDTVVVPVTFVVTSDATAPSPPVSVVATAGDANVALTWAAPSVAEGVTGHRVYRAEGVRTLAAIADVTTGTTYTDTGVANGTEVRYAVTALDAAGNESLPSQQVRATPALPVVAPTVKVNFQAANGGVPLGYVRDNGQAFGTRTGENQGTGLSYGWVLPGTSTPLDLSVGGTLNGNARTRTGTGSNPDPRLSSFLHMQGADIPTFNGTRTNGAWELALPNGSYTVRVAVGEPNVGIDPERHALRLEGVPAITGFVPAGVAGTISRHYLATRQVTVADGRLTVDATGGTNTKINFIDVAPTGTPAAAVLQGAPSPVVLSAPVGGTDSETLAVTVAGVADGTAGYVASEDSPWLTVTPAVGSLPGSAVLSANAAGLAAGSYVATVVLTGAGLDSATIPVELSVTPGGAASFTAEVNFQSATAPVPAGYLRDFGEAYGPRSGADQGTGLSYGWVGVGTQTPLNLVGNGRDRDRAGIEQRLDTVVHMQGNNVANFTGVATPGTWEIAVPVGTYRVVASAGDQGPLPTGYDSVHVLNVEGSNLLSPFQATSAQEYRSGTATVRVTDGRLTVDPRGGSNTKINYIMVTSVALDDRPAAIRTRPASGDGEVAIAPNIDTDLSLPNINGGVDEATLSDSTVTLTRLRDGVRLPGRVTTSGGRDTISFDPDALLEPATTYRYEVTEGVEDLTGAAFLPFAAVFTTAAGDGTVPPPVIPGTPGVTDTGTAAFDKVALPGATGRAFSSVTMGPDGRLYAATLTGEILRYAVNADGTLGTGTEIRTVITNNAGQPRMIIGIAFPPGATTADTLYLSHSEYSFDSGNDWTGKISRLTGPELAGYTDLVFGLPRSKRDHLTNSLAFGPDGGLYFVQGSNSAMGAPDNGWGNRNEHLLTAAVLRLDLAALPAGPLDVQTEARGANEGLVGRTTGTFYDPYAPGAPLTIYATGMRNAYDLVWHSNGRLYVPTNGSAAGGNTPSVGATRPASCDRRPDAATYQHQAVTGITGNPTTQHDWLFRVEKGGYYGNPNPTRCEWVLNQGNPTAGADGPGENTRYPVGTAADRNYRGWAFDFDLNKSPNGAVEYQSDAFAGKLKGKLLVVRYSNNDDILVLEPGGTAGDIVSTRSGVAGTTGFSDPLDLTEDVRTGALYVTELAGSRITLLRPRSGGVTAPTIGFDRPKVVLNDTIGAGSSAPQSVLVRNDGSSPLSVSGVTATGGFAVTAGALPRLLNPGASFSVPVTFTAAATGVATGTLTVTSNDVVRPTVTLPLRGLGTQGLGGANEPSLQRVLDVHGAGVVVGDPDPATNGLPTSALLGEEVPVQRFVQASQNVVTVETLAVFGPDASNPVTRFGWYESGAPASVQTLAEVTNSPTSNAQTVAPPVGPLSFEPGDNLPFGFASTWPFFGNRTIFSEDTLNTFSGAVPHHVRVYPYRPAGGAVEPNAYVVAFEETTSGHDYQDLVLLVRNVKPAGAPAAGARAEVQAEAIGSGVRGSSTTRMQPVVVRNTGAAPLTVTGATVTGPFSVTGTPLVIAAGASASLPVRFTPSTAQTGQLSGTLTLTTDAAATPSLTVALYGLSTAFEQGGGEPALNDVVGTLGIGVNVGGTGLILGTQPAPSGDEVLAPLFRALPGATPTLTPVARYSPDDVLPFGWYTAPTGTPVRTEVGQVALDNEQTLLPAVLPGSSPAFTPGTAAFGIYVDGLGDRFSYTQDGLNTGPTAHAARIYPAPDRTGRAVPGRYLVTFEDAENGDYQDYVFLLTGVQPAGVSTAVEVKVDFTTAAGALVAGYTRDSGQAYDAARGLGWVVPGTSTPVDLSLNTRERATPVGDVRRTIVLMQGTGGATQPNTGSYEIALAPGTYDVTVGVGDSAFVDSVHQVEAEGVELLAPFTPTATEPFRTVTGSVTVSDGRLTLSTRGTNTKLTHVEVARQGSSLDTVAPTVSLALTGATQPGGDFRNEALLTVTAADSGGSGLAVTAYSVDGGEFLPYTAPVRLTEPGSHSVRARAIDGAGLVTTTASRAYVLVIPPPSRAEVSVENLDGVPYPDRLVMSRIQNPETDPAPNGVHDLSTLRVRNTGVEALTVLDATVTGPFALEGAPSLPASVPVGGSLDLPVRFTAQTVGTAGGLHLGTLVVRTDDADETLTTVELAGFWQSVSEGGQEPDVAEITRTFGYGTRITVPGQSVNSRGAYEPIGDEVLSPYWKRLDTRLPVTVRQLGAFHTQGATATFFTHAKGSFATQGRLTHRGIDGQTVLPRLNGGAANAPASASFTPATDAAGAFGLKIDPEWSDPTRNNNAIDRDNGCTAVQCGHHLRTWPVRDRAGVLVPGSYLIGMDYAGINYDFNDNVYLVTNITPEVAAADRSAPGLAPGAASLDLDFSTARPGTLVDADGQGTGFAATQANRLDTAPLAGSYVPAGIDLDSAAGRLLLTSRGSLTTGSNAGNDNTLVNGLVNRFDAGLSPWSATTRILGPVTAYSAGSQQAGLMVGAGQDDFVKISLINKTGPSIELYGESGGVGGTVGTAITLPNPAAITGVELALLGDPGTRRVRGAYRIDGGAWIVLPTAYQASPATAGRFFGTATEAGLVTTHKGTEAPVTTAFDAFAVVQGDVTGTTPVRPATTRVDTGSAVATTTVDGRVFTPDTGLFAPATAPAEGSAASPIAATVDDALYATYRGNVGTVTPRRITYTVPSLGATTVDLRLHLAERSGGNNATGRRVMDVTVDGVLVRTGLDLFALTGGVDRALVLDLRGVAVSGPTIEIALLASVDYPAVSGFEVLCVGTCPAPDTTPPPAVTGVTAVGSTAGNTISWAASTAADLGSYRVERSTDGVTWTPVSPAGLTALTLLDSTAVADVATSYRVVAIDASGNASAPSTVAVATRLDATPPAAPTGLVATAAIAGTTLDWADNTETDLAGYRVSRAVGTGTPEELARPTASTYVDAGAPVGVAVTYRVVAVDRLGNVSAAATATATRPAPPTGAGTTIRVNTGGSAQTVAGTTWSACTALTACSGWVTGGFPYSAGTPAITGVVAPASAALYQNEWTGGQSNGIAVGARAFGFRFPVANGGYRVRLHFAENNQPAVGRRIFDVNVQGGPVELPGLDIFAATGGLHRALVRELPVTVTDGAVTVDFIRRVENAKISAIEILPVTTPAPDTTAPPAVTGLAATTATTGITLDWADSPATDLASYEVARGTGTAAPVVLASPTASAYTDLTAPVGTEVTYRVVAVDGARNRSTPVTVTATRPAAPPTGGQVVARINTGGPAVTVAGQVWDADRLFTGGRPFTNTALGDVAGTTADALYRDERSASGAPTAFSYTIPVPASGTYTVRLHFAEIWFGAPGGGPAGAGRRVFSVNAEGGAVEVANLDLFATAGAATAVVREVQVPVTDGQLNLAFSASINAPTIAALEVLAPGAPPVVTRPTVRLNTGGPAVTAGGVTWAACALPAACGTTTGTGGFGVVSGTPAITGTTATAPAAIYQSEWTGGAVGAAGTTVPVGSVAFGYDVPVSNGDWTVRLHFAENVRTAAGQRLFDVNLEGGTAELTGFDVFAAAGGRNRAIVREFPVTVTDGKVDIDFIRRVENAKISAIEVLPR